METVRTLPEWLRESHRFDDDSNLTEAEERESVPPPTAAHFARHKRHRRAPGRKYDALRTKETPIARRLNVDDATRWRRYIETSGGSPPYRGEPYLRTEQQRDADYPDLYLPYESKREVSEDHRGMLSKFGNMLLRRAMVPLILRSIVGSFSLSALVLSVSIFQKVHNPEVLDYSKRSTLMAIIVDAVALPYLMYITYDEYTGAPLGLRASGAKIRLIFLDLFFIVFASANLSLAFEVVSKLPPCTGTLKEMQKCNPQGPHQEALASVLLIALVAWLLTFSISMLRLIERVKS